MLLDEMAWRACDGVFSNGLDFFGLRRCLHIPREGRVSRFSYRFVGLVLLLLHSAGTSVGVIAFV